MDPFAPIEIVFLERASILPIGSKRREIPADDANQPAANVPAFRNIAIFKRAVQVGPWVISLSITI